MKQKNKTQEWALGPKSWTSPSRLAKQKWQLVQKLLPATRSPGIVSPDISTLHRSPHWLRQTLQVVGFFPIAGFSRSPSHQVTPMKGLNQDKYGQGIKSIPMEELTEIQGQKSATSFTIYTWYQMQASGRNFCSKTYLSFMILAWRV